MIALKIFVVALMVLYILLLLIYRLRYPRKNPHRMVSFWVILVLSALVITGAIFMLIIFAIGGYFKP